jgi:hypothetical protein
MGEEKRAKQVVGCIGLNHFKPQQVLSLEEMLIQPHLTPEQRLKILKMLRIKEKHSQLKNFQKEQSISLKGSLTHFLQNEVEQELRKKFNQHQNKESIISLSLKKIAIILELSERHFDRQLDALVASLKKKKTFNREEIESHFNEEDLSKEMHRYVEHIFFKTKQTALITQLAPTIADATSKALERFLASKSWKHWKHTILVRTLDINQK